MYVSVIHIWPTTENFILLNVQATLGNKMAESTEQELRNAHEEEEKGIPELSMLPISLGGQQMLNLHCWCPHLLLL